MRLGTGMARSLILDVCRRDKERRSQAWTTVEMWNRGGAGDVHMKDVLLIEGARVLEMDGRTIGGWERSAS